MRLTRHAKNRLRLIRRLAPELSDERVLAAVAQGSPHGEDDRGNRRVRVRIDAYSLIVVVDDVAEIVITVWREE